MSNDLSDQHCTPCKGGIPPMNAEEIQKHIQCLPGWNVINNHHLEKTFRFKKYNQTMQFVNSVAQIAESENHHPEMHVSYGKVQIEIFTHAVGGLSQNDFILAAKITEIQV